MTDPRTTEDSQRRESTGGVIAVAKAVVWMILGGAIVAVVLLSGVLPNQGLEEAESSDEVQLWTCGMHPEVLQEEPGICPICHMDLTPLAAGSASDSEGEGHWTCPVHSEHIEEPEAGVCPICGRDLVYSVDGVLAEASPAGHQGAEVRIDPVVVQNMNVRVVDVERRELTRAVRTVGHLDYNEERMVSITTRYEGFIEKVFVDFVGQPVATGEPLFEVYSPQLVQTQQELLAALRYARRLENADLETRGRAQSLVDSARQRLAYWDVTPEQLASIEASGEVLRTITVVSPIGGVVMQRVHGLEGMAIRPGMEALHVVDLSSLWLTVEVYEDQLPWLGEGSSAEVTFDYLPGERFSGRVRYIEPEVSPSTRTVKLTLEVPNRRNRLRVGMYATVTFAPRIASDAVVVPAQAVIRSGERDLVVIALGEGRFAPREIVLGVESEGWLQVLEGLDGDEQIVTSAQFLIDSESNLRAAVEKMIADSLGHRH
jgi:Cu(I)/Ag(I) efflux system membrane fusion protein/cobalt-zinc-cadmium efflux system membrane fusion protein